jgi:hypothetical protein
MFSHPTTFRIGLIAGAIGLGLLGVTSWAQALKPTPKPTPAAKPTPTKPATSSPAATPAPADTPTPATASAPAATPTPTKPAAPTPTATATPTATPTATATATATPVSPAAGAATGAAAGAATAAPPQVQGAPPFLAGISVDHADGVYRQGELLTLKCQAERDAYLYVLYRQANGETALIFPNGLQPDNQVKAKTPVALPPPGDIVYRVQPPLGDESLQVLAVEKPLAELQALVRDRGRAVIVPKATLETLQKYLDQHRDAWTEHNVKIRTVARDAPSPQAPKRVGLFIGIGEYADAKVYPPNTALSNSAAVIHELMLQKGKLDPQATRLLRDKQASKAEIRKSMTEWLPSVSQPGDTVFIYFSGRAGSFQADDPAETDGFDEALIPHDMSFKFAATSPQEILKAVRERSILDDELAYWLQSLAGRQVVLILDASYGGGVVEGKNMAGGFELESQRVKDISQVNVSVMTSCSPDEQTTIDKVPKDTLWFTHCLMEVMRNSPAGRPLLVEQGFLFAQVKLAELVPEGSPFFKQKPELVNRTLLPIYLIP